MRYPTLLSPVKVGATILKNRLGYPNASPHFLQGPETYPAEPYRAFTANLAKNGAAFITVATWDNYPQQRNGPADMDMTHMQAFDMTDPSVHNYMSQMCEEVHFYGSKLILTLPIPYPDGYSLHGGTVFGRNTAPIPLEQIPEVVENYVKKARLYRNLGFDGVNIRCDTIMNPAENERTDAYGGSIENRTRILRECFAAARKALGRGFLITGSVAWEQPNGYGRITKAGAGYSEEDCARFCHLFDDLVDIYEVREHDACASHPTGYSYVPGYHPAVDFCARMKAEGIHALMMPLGGFQEPDEMERYLVEGKCDMIGAARAFMADYEYGKKLYEGRGEDITPCLHCNKCHGVMLPEPAPWTTICAVNPLQGLSHKLHRMVEDTTTPKKVAVIGGGPAGMRAAIYAAERGHQVTLFEQSDKLGGLLFHSDYFSFKWPVRNFRDWLIRQLGTHNVDVRMNTRPTPQMIKAGGYDAVIAATGSKINVPKIDGIYDESGALREGVMSWADTCGHAEKLGHRVTVVGGSEVGIETAMYLAELGHEVTVLTRQDRIAHNASGLHYITMAQVIVGEDGYARESAAWLKYPNLHTVTKATTKRVEGTNVIYTDQEGSEITVEGDSVVLCGGLTPLTDAAMEYAGLTDVFYAIGDCNGAGNLENCNREAYARAMLI